MDSSKKTNDNNPMSCVKKNIILKSLNCMYLNIFHLSESTTVQLVELEILQRLLNILLFAPNKSLSAVIENNMPTRGKIKNSLVYQLSLNWDSIYANTIRVNDGKTQKKVFFFDGFSTSEFSINKTISFHSCFNDDILISVVFLPLV